MRAGEFDEVRELYHRLHDLSAAERAQRLDALGVRDSVRKQVEALFAGADDMTAFEEPGAVAQELFGELSEGRRAAARPAHPESIAGYRVEGVLGRGGAGVVYRGTQAHPAREVAIKVLHHLGLVPNAVRRFEYEAETLARLDHPYVANVIEAGVDKELGDLPYIVMELVEGEDLVSYCDRRRLGDPERIALFRKVCEGVEHAHQRGIVHRDLKPANILVSEEGRPRILDFGIARPLDHGASGTPGLTAEGSMLGTLAWMSPEQASGRIEDLDLRSDVYSLGSLLYRLLSGQMPLDVEGLAPLEAARTICETEPRRLSQHKRTLRGDLEAIVARALDKEPDRRYANAGELERDLARFSQHQPVEARPWSTAYQLKKFARRNKALVGGAAATFVALLAGLVSSWVLLREANRSRDEAQLAREQVEAVADFQSRLLRNLRPSALGRELFATIEARLQASLDASPVGDEERAVAMKALADTLEGLNSTDLAREVMSELFATDAVELIDEYADDAGTEARLRYAVGILYKTLGTYDEAREQLERSLELRREHLGPEHPLTLQVLQSLAGSVRLMGLLDEAAPLLQECLEARRRVLGENHVSTIRTASQLGQVYIDMKDFEEAERLLLDAFDRYETLQAEGDAADHEPLNALGRLYFEQGRQDEAQAIFRRLLEINKRSFGEDHPSTILVRNNLMTSLFSSNSMEPAAGIAREVMESSIRVNGNEHPRSILARNNLGVVLIGLGRAEEAASVLGEGHALAREALPPGHTFRIKCTANYGDALLDLGRAAESEPICREALSLRQDLNPPRPVEVAQSFEQLGRCLLALEEFVLAEDALRECVALREGIDRDHWQTHDARNLLGVALSGQERFSEAGPLLAESLEALEGLAATMPAWKREAVLERARRRTAQADERSSGRGSTPEGGG